MADPQTRWFISWKIPIWNRRWLGVPPISGNLHILTDMEVPLFSGIFSMKWRNFGKPPFKKNHIQYSPYLHSIYHAFPVSRRRSQISGSFTGAQGWPKAGQWAIPWWYLWMRPAVSSAQPMDIARSLGSLGWGWFPQRVGEMIWDELKCSLMSLGWLWQHLKELLNDVESCENDFGRLDMGIFWISPRICRGSY